MKSLTLKLVPKPALSSPDALALARVADGDLGALGEVYDRHAAALLRFASRATGGQDAEDVLQATFMRAATIAQTYDGRAATARSWLFGIMARLVQERRRSLTRFARALFGLSQSSGRERAHSDAHRSDLERGLRSLSAPKRMVLLLAEVEGYTCAEIAGMLEIPVGTVWTRLHHARKELRAFYGESS